jgi:DNA repair exonuclease SbcCD ATPase subunit/DNA repair exonuclease SbcCD nuclease subunit
MIHQTLSSNRVNKVDNVIHIADVHIRNFKRHDEYESVFNRVYDYCKEQVQQDKNTIIYLAGDIVHAKTDMSPELIVMTRNFLVNLADIAPVILIAGNHDMNLNNRNRLDALSPIVDSIDTPDFFYFKDTGVYTLGGVDFILNAVHENPDNFIYANDVKSDNIKIVLYHGALDRAYLSSGNTINNSRLNIQCFDGFDYGMFGDIHSFQYLDTNSKFAYAGSLIQQNFGEGTEHGIINWNLLDGTSKFVRINNDWAYYTIDVDGGKFVNLPTTFSINNRIRVRSFNTSNSQLFKQITKLKSLIKIDDIRIQKMTSNLTDENSNTKISIGDVRDVEYQNKLITEYLEKNFSVQDDVVDEVRKINREINRQIDQNVVLRNVIWTPIRFEFDNMFSYGANNWIDFSQMNGTYGIFASNASGKSSILDALMFCIFDKCSRTYKASQIINNKKDDFRCKFQFQINGVDYFIERFGKKNKQGNVKVTLNFWCEENGEIKSLNGDDRDGTNSSIRNYLGTYDDFIITALSLQGNNTNFIDKTQSERKDLLAQFLDLNLFEELNAIAIDEIKSVQTLIKEYSRQDYSTKITDANTKYNEFSEQLSNLSVEKNKLKKSIESTNKKIISLTKSLKPIDTSLLGQTLEDLIELKKELGEQNILCEQNVNKLQDELNILVDNLSKEQEKLQGIDYSILLEDKKKLDGLQNKLTNLRNTSENIILNISHNQSKLDNLSTHEYDPDCQYCVNNVFVQDAKNAEKILLDLKKQLFEVRSEINNVEIEIGSIQNPSESIKSFNELEKKILTDQRKVSEIENSITKYKSNCDKFLNKMSETEELIHKFIINKSDIRYNEKIQVKIETLEHNRDNYNKEFNKIDSEIIYVNGELKIQERIIKDSTDSIKKLQELESKYVAYDYYLKSVNRNGVPYQLISDAIPKIQSEVNSILSQIVDFEILFDTDGKSINTFILYDSENYWPLEMTSGMEKFISSLAIRTALINISSLPRPNFIGIDEGWGTLDSDNLNSISMFFEYMKTQFDFLLTISHIDALRDIVDSVIDIHKENGFSVVRF